MKRYGLFLTMMAALALKGCQPPVKADSAELEHAEKLTWQGVLESTIIPAGEEYLAFHLSDTMYLLRPNLNRSGKEPVQVKFLYRDGSEESKTAHLLDFGKALLDGETGLLLGKVPFDSLEFKSIQSVMVSTAEKSDRNRGALKMDVGQFFRTGNQICELGLADWQKQVYSAVFKEQLKTGLFAEFPHEFYLLLSRKSCWVITSDKLGNQAEFMLHFIKTEGGFENYSFPLSGPSFENCSGNFEGVTLHRINLGRDLERYLRIRIGQYDTGGNLWAQEYKIERLLANPLLRYQGELRGFAESPN